ncbi:class I/II aminotransferase [Helicosporidium sp. ATCC 50920]|nr:class I/II aminotransferase [Helicosporidium sp. ATCC 50920]|eukprot:KDD72845.1 class I/II aminotransferase [Helicosporidium sp. ATCC 50920]
MLKSIAELVLEHPRLLVLSDEIYEYIQYTDDDGTDAARDAASPFPPSIASLPGMAERTLTVNGFSKAYAMTGWRLGYVAGPLPLARAMNIVQSQSTSGPSSIAQHAALAALAMGSRGGKVVQETVRAFQRRRDLVVEKLRAMPGVALPEVPMGAFYALPNVSGLVGKGRSAKGYGPIPDAEALADYLLQSAHVAVVPGDAFGVPESLRLSFALADDQLERALDRMAEALARVE